MDSSTIISIISGFSKKAQSGGKEKLNFFTHGLYSQRYRQHKLSLLHVMGTNNILDRWLGQIVMPLL